MNKGLIERIEPVCWRREWDGDDSDLYSFVHADSRDELDDLGPWEPLYSHADVQRLQSELAEEKAARERLEKRQKWLDEVGPAQHPDDERHWAMAYVRAKEQLEEREKALRELLVKALDEITLFATWDPEPTRAYQRECVMPAVRKAVRHIEAARALLGEKQNG